MRAQNPKSGAAVSFISAFLSHTHLSRLSHILLLLAVSIGVPAHLHVPGLVGLSLSGYFGQRADVQVSMLMLT